MKPDEHKLYDEFLERLPRNGYLYEILKGIEIDVKRAIDNDFCFISWTEMYESQKLHRLQIEAGQRQLGAIAAEKKQMESDLARLKRAIDDAKGEIRVMARTAGIL